VHNIGDNYYIYDANGRLVEKRESKKGFRPQSWRYQWDSEGQLAQVTKPDGEQWEYGYDPNAVKLSDNPLFLLELLPS
jgi:uncharacterized protein RhaS with RHS repeats